ncbi:MAG: DUF2442 domain-containing protein [Cytophagales bacterium]|nr:DUF2442 domain-containing protein [Cytophagales bacterium]
MKIEKLLTEPNGIILIRADDGRVGKFDIKPYLGFEAFEPLREPSEFLKIKNGGYFVEWECGADLSADTIEARMTPVQDVRL